MAERSSERSRMRPDGLLTRWGRVGFSRERTLWIHGRRRRDFEAAIPLVRALRDHLTRLNILLTTADPSTRQWLATTCPDAIVLAPPLRFGKSAGRYMLNLNVRGLVMLGEPEPGDRYILRAAYGRAAPAALLQTAAGRGSAEPADLAGLGSDLTKFQHFFVSGSAARRYLIDAGIAEDSVTSLSDDGADPGATVLPVLVQLLRLDIKVMRSSQQPVRRWLERQALRCMDHPRLRRRVSFKVERFDTIDQLDLALGKPATILCLGNGPSSEEPEVGAVEYDCLFRVNHIWLKRGFLAKPDMVFTGSKPTLAAVRGAIFGLLTTNAEGRLLVRHFLHPGLRRVRYAAIERFALFISEPRWQDIRPTNGAVMLATAVALQPSRLVISGVDLFNHPAGSYPGDSTTPNAYSQGHEAESELALLLEALSRYEGELIILSSALRQRWEEYQGRNTVRHDAAG